MIKRINKEWVEIYEDLYRISSITRIEQIYFDKTNVWVFEIHGNGWVERVEDNEHESTELDKDRNELIKIVTGEE